MGTSALRQRRGRGLKAPRLHAFDLKVQLIGGLRWWRDTYLALCLRSISERSIAKYVPFFSSQVSCFKSQNSTQVIVEVAEHFSFMVILKGSGVSKGSIAKHSGYFSASSHGNAICFLRVFFLAMDPFEPLLTLGNVAIRPTWAPPTSPNPFPNPTWCWFWNSKLGPGKFGPLWDTLPPSKL